MDFCKHSQPDGSILSSGFQGCGPKIYTFIRGTKQLQALRFLGVAMGVAQILAMALTLMLLWALYYGHESPELDSMVQPTLDDSTPFSLTHGPSHEALKSGCHNMSSSGPAAIISSKLGELHPEMI